MVDKQSKADGFVADILEAHTNYINSSRRGFRYALDCGKLLNLAKEDLIATKGEGHWLAWLKEKTGIPQTTASLYMRLAEHRDKFLDDNDQVLETGEVGKLSKNGELSLRAAAELLPKRTRAKKSGPAAATPATTTTPAPTTSGDATSPAPSDVETPTNVFNLPSPELKTVLLKAGYDKVFDALCETFPDQLLKLSADIAEYLAKLKELENQEPTLAKTGTG